MGQILSCSTPSPIVQEHPSVNILKFDDSEYFIDDLPEEGKQLLMGLRTADAQTKMYQDTLKLISVGKNKMIEDLKKILDNIEPIQNG